MERYGNVILDVEQMNAERWDWKIYQQIGERALFATWWTESAASRSVPAPPPSHVVRMQIPVLAR
jgi:hypothetical protein